MVEMRVQQVHGSSLIAPTTRVERKAVLAIRSRVSAESCDVQEHVGRGEQELDRLGALECELSNSH